MTVAEFLDWHPQGGIEVLWQLRDGEPDGVLRLGSIGFVAPLRAAYRSSGLG